MQPDLTEDQRVALNEVYLPFRRDSEWPEYQYVDKALYRRGLDVQEILPSLPPGLMVPDPARASFFAQPSDRLALTIAGLATCDGSQPDLDLFVRAVKFFVRCEDRYPSSARSGWIEGSCGLDFAWLLGSGSRKREIV